MGEKYFASRILRPGCGKGKERERGSITFGIGRKSPEVDGTSERKDKASGKIRKEKRNFIDCTSIGRAPRC